MAVAISPTILSDAGRSTFPDLAPRDLLPAFGKSSGLPWHTFFVRMGAITFLTATDGRPTRLPLGQREASNPSS